MRIMVGVVGLSEMPGRAYWRSLTQEEIAARLAVSVNSEYEGVGL